MPAGINIFNLIEIAIFSRVQPAPQITLIPVKVLSP